MTRVLTERVLRYVELMGSYEASFTSDIGLTMVEVRTINRCFSDRGQHKEPNSESWKAT